MKDGDFWQLGDVSDTELQTRLSQLLVNGYRTEARIVAHLAEVEERRLHLRAGSSSMFDYCVRRLGLSNGEAFQRLTVARLARQFPVIFDLIERREVHMSGLCLLRDYLTTENHLELLAGVSHKTKFQILEMLARHFPRPDVASTLRKLPSTSAASVDVALATASDRSAIPTLVARPPSVAPKEMASATPKPRQTLEPLSEARYRLQLNVTASMREKLELARALLSHSVPSGDFAELLERLGRVARQDAKTALRPEEVTAAREAVELGWSEEIACCSVAQRDAARAYSERNSARGPRA